MSISGSTFDAALRAIVQSFDLDALKMLVRVRHGFVLARIVPLPATLDSVVFNLLERAEAEGWILDLLRSASETRLNNEVLANVLARAEREENRHAVSLQLETIIDADAIYLDPEQHVENLRANARRVCRLELPLGDNRFQFGTGFLVAEDLAITNYHVLEPLIEDTVSPADLTVRFDYVVRGSDEPDGVTYRLAADWLYDHSAYSDADLSSGGAPSPRPDQLDYAIVRLDLSSASKNIWEPRGFISLGDPFIGSRMPLFILQHPRGERLKLAARMPAEVRVNENGTRIQYDVNTEPGSSGSAVFNGDWRLVALHHAGDPDYEIGRKPRLNQGIPAVQIANLLKSRDKSLT
jgi:hypothetical protein